jgi:ammonia channel protein AmtB
MIVQALDQTREYAALLVPLISWVIIKFILRLTLTRTDIIVTGVLAGLIGATPVPVDASIVVVLKGVVFLFIFSYLRIAFPTYY